jgi:hypothetical protein
MDENDLKQGEVIEADPILKNPQSSVVQESLTSEIEVLPPVMREIPQTRDHQKDEQLALQIRDMGRLGLSKSSTALAARISTYLLDKYYSDEFLEGQSQMQKGLATVAIAEAMNGNTPILLHLLKTKLGWSEQQTLEITGEIRSVVSAKPMSKEEFVQRYLTQESED